MQQQHAIKFCVELNKSATDTLAMLQEATGSIFLFNAQVLRWHNAFKDRRRNVDDEQHTGHYQVLKLQIM